MVAFLTLVRAPSGQAQVVAEVTIAGQSFPTIDEAIAAALPGEIVVIGAGTLTLTAPVVVPVGVAIEGASAGSTRLDATGLEAGIRITAGLDGEAVSGSPLINVRGLEIFGAVRGIEVSGVQGVVIRNVVLRENVESGLYVAAGADATLVNGTLVKNGIGVMVLGSARVRNSIITGGGGGLSASVLGALVSSYNDTFGNSGPTYERVLRGKGDLSFMPLFVASENNDFHLTATQSITDRGDPTDEFVREPQPNGGRINLGAFGNTAEAEMSKPMEPKSSGGCVVAGVPVGEAGNQVTTPWTSTSTWGGFAIAGLFCLARGRRRRLPVRARCPVSRADCRS